VAVKGKFHQKIREVLVSDPTWASKHWKTIVHWYARARHFERYREFFEELYREPPPDLSSINYRFIKGICQLLGIQTKLSPSSAYNLIEGKTERLIHLCQLAGATEYVSGPSAEAYLDTETFRQSGISVSYFRYDGYPPHRQLHPPFEHRVSIIDLLFNEGPDAVRHMLSFSQPGSFPSCKARLIEADPIHGPAV
jgi:hypothetical protein